MCKIKKKILVLSSYPANYRVAVFEGLANEFELTVLFSRNKNEDRNSDWFVKEARIPFSLVCTEEGKRKMLECRKHLKKYDLILAYDFRMKWALRILLKAKLLGIPYILNSDGSFLIKKRFPVEQIKRFFISNASAWLASGEYAKQNFINYGAKEEKVYIHNFTSLHQEDILNEIVPKEKKQSLKKELGLQEGGLILSIGQFIVRKGFDILLEAWKECQGKGYQLVIIGGGQMKSEYERIIRENCLVDVSLLDYVPFDIIKKYYMAADFFVLPTREDIWGLVVNEAMAYGLPIISTDRCIAGLELIENGVNGFIVKTEDSDDLSDRINYLLDHPKEIESMGAANLSKIHHWTIENVVNSNIDTINKVLTSQTAV